MKKIKNIILFYAIFLCGNQVSFAQNVDELANAFGHIPDFAGLRLSPHGDKIVTLMNYEGQRILVTKSMTDPSVAPVGIPFDDGEFRWVKWVSNDRLIAGVRYSAIIRQDKPFKRGSRGEVVEFTTTRLVSMDWDGENFVLLSKRNRNRNFQPQFQDNVINMLPDDPEHVLLSLDVSVQNQPAVYKLNVYTNDRSLVHDDLRHVTQWVTDGNHNIRLSRGREDTPRINKSRRFANYRKAINDEWIMLYDYDVREEEPPFEFLGFAENTDHIYVSQISDTGFKGIYKMNVDTQEIVETIAESEEYDLRGVQFNSSGQMVGFTFKHQMFKRVNFDEQGQRFYQEFHFWTQFFAANGYAVLQINYRGAGWYGKYYENLGKGEIGRKIIQDVNEGTKWMIDKGYADPDRICIAGDTYGAYVSLQVPVVAPSLYKCSIAHAPITSFEAFLRHKRDFVGYNYLEALISNDEWDLNDASPLFNIDNMNIPVLLFHGEKDMSIPVSESRVYAERMKRSKKDIKYIEFEDADAYLSRQEHRVEFLKEMGYFLQKHLK